MERGWAGGRLLRVSNSCLKEGRFSSQHLWFRMMRVSVDEGLDPADLRSRCSLSKYLGRKVGISDEIMNLSEPDVAIVGKKGQIVIPATLRNRLRIKPKSKLLVYGLNDAIVLKKLTLPDERREMASLWREIDRRIEKYGELSYDEIQGEIEKGRMERRRRPARGA